jgi:ribonuclease BN (tRNA processing enzyme)
VGLGPFRVEPVPVEHPVPAFGLRVTADGATLGYSGDTGPCAGLDEVARDADLLLAEASFVTGEDNPDNLHLTGTDGGDAAARMGARRLVITHVPPWYDPEVALAEARAVYDGPSVLARAGDVHEV